MMNFFSILWGKLGLQLRLHILIQGSLVVILVTAQFWLADQFKQQAFSAVQTRAVEVADGVINGLNTLMVIQSGDKEAIRDKSARSLFIQKMGASDHIKEMRLIRSKQLEEQFSTGLPQEQPADEIDRQVLANGKPSYQLLVGKNGEASFRTVMPFVASKNFRTTNCLKCHDVNEGAVLGAASVTIDIKSDLARIKKTNGLIWVFQILLQFILYFVIGFIVRRLSLQLGGEPSYVIDIVNQIAQGNLTQNISTQHGDSKSLLVAVKHMQLQRKQAQEALEESRVQLADIVSFLPDATLAIDKVGKIIIWNKAIEAMTGVPAAEMIGKGNYEYAIPFYGHRRPQLVDLALMDSAEQRIHYLKIHHEGNSIVAEAYCNALHENQGAWVFIKATPLHDRFDNVIGAIEVIRDINKDKLAEEGLRLAASVFTYAREAIVITDPDGTIIEVNDTFTSITGHERQDVIGKNPKIFKSGRHDAEFYKAMWKCLIESGHWHGEIWNKNKSGIEFAELLTISAVRDQQNKTQNYVALFSDITQIKEHQSELEHIAHYDGLTALPNRILLTDRLLQAMRKCKRRGQSMAVVYLDLDGFKTVNDTHGHAVGDQLLIAVSNRMQQVLREGDTLARIGGDEFVVVLDSLTDYHHCEPLIARLLAASASPVHVNDSSVQVSASLGVTFYPQVDDIDADMLLRQADQAMYQAKVAGKNRYHVFDAEHDRNVRGHHESLEHIRRALIQNEFVLHYQPKVNMRTGAIIGAEALIRWQHPERGLLSPALFLPVIEDHPLAVQLGKWVIDTALTQMDIWQQVGLNIPVAVNIGARQLQSLDFVQSLCGLLEKHPSVVPNDLQFEVLETSALEDIAQVSEVINDCREMGVNFALDDFGTGYSSLTYLKRLPVNLLKIDQSFVRDMLVDPDDLSILQGVLGMAKAFGREVIAEGVETTEHGVMLLRLGCELAQGYGIARPMPGHEMQAWTSSWRLSSAWLNLRSVNSDDLPLIFAGVEHRASAQALERRIKDGQQKLPFLEHNQCRFGAWIESKGQARFGNLESFKSIDTLHKSMHEIVRNICKLQFEGKTEDALGRLGQLHELRKSMLEEIGLFEKEVEF